jgi:hypothetical protein
VVRAILLAPGCLYFVILIIPSGLDSASKPFDDALKGDFEELRCSLHE